ncbi:MAG: DUF1801 domain-containing protein [Saprospiraceae bacterium]|nr:DUF1801 domain-containing protein [Saprospiraceae bacterium]
MDFVLDFILEQEEPNRSILEYLHEVLSREPELVPRIRYDIPFYFRTSWVCYLKPIKEVGVELAFTRGNELSNANGLLDNRGRSQVAGVIYTSIKEIDLRPLQETLQEALLLDETVKYKSKRK